MSGKNLIICDSSFSYANFLMENMMEKEELFVDVQACTSWECAKELLEEKPADIMLVDEKWETDAKGQIGIGQVVCLVENRESEEENEKIYICNSKRSLERILHKRPRLQTSFCYYPTRV